MRTAPRKRYATGGETVDGDPNKPLSQKLTPEEWAALNAKSGNVEYPYGSATAKGYKQYYDPNKWKVEQDPSTKEVYSTPLDPSYKGYPSVELYNYEYQAPPKVKPQPNDAIYSNVHPKTKQQIDYQNITPLKAKGGLIKRAPKRYGGKSC